MISKAIIPEQLRLLQDLFSRKSLDSIRYCVKDKELADFQTVAVAYAIIVKSCIIGLDTGKGKTVVAAGIMNIIHELYPNTKWVFICQRSNLETTFAKLKQDLINCKIVYSTAEESQLIQNFLYGEAKLADIIVLTYDNIKIPIVSDFLYQNRMLIKGMIADEAQVISQGVSQASNIISAMMSNIEYTFFLTATPLTISPAQIINLGFMLDRDLYGEIHLAEFVRGFEVRSDGRIVGYKNLENLESYLGLRYIYLNRDTEGCYKSIYLDCNSKPAYKDVKKADVNSIIKGDPDGEAIKRLTQFILSKMCEGKRGLVYINTNKNKDFVRDHLKASGIRVGILDGAHTNNGKKKGEAQTAFNGGELDVMLTNIVTGKDLPCDYIVFYELTFDFKQMIGRGVRTLGRFSLEIGFVIVKDTKDVDYFFENVYARGLLLKAICGKNIDELEHIKSLLFEDGCIPDSMLEIMMNDDNSTHEFTEEE